MLWQFGCIQSLLSSGQASSIQTTLIVMNNYIPGSRLGPHVTLAWSVSQIPSQSIGFCPRFGFHVHFCAEKLVFHKITHTPDFVECTCGLVLAGCREHRCLAWSFPSPKIYMLSSDFYLLSTSRGRQGQLWSQQDSILALARSQNFQRINKDFQAQCEKMNFTCFSALNLRNVA